MTGENTYFIGEDNVISIGTITLEQAMREINTVVPIAEDKSEKASFVYARSPSYNGDLSVDDISNNEVSAVIIKNDENDGSFVTPGIKKEEDQDPKSALKRNQSVQLKKTTL